MKKDNFLNKFIKGKVNYYVNRWSAFFQVAMHFMPHVRKQYQRLSLSLLAGIGFTIAGLLEPWPLKIIFDNVFYEEPMPHLVKPLLEPYFGNKLMMLNILIGSIIVISTLRGICYYYQQLLTSRAGQQTVAAIRLDLYGHLQRLSFSFHDKRRTGDMLARLTTDIRILRDILITVPLNATSEFLLMLSMVIVMAFMDWQLTLIALMVIPLLWLLIQRYRSPMKEAMRMQREREGHLTSIASEVLGAIKVVQGFDQEGFEVKKFSVENKNSLKSGLKATRLEAKLRWASELAVAIVTAIVLGIAGRRVLMEVLSPGDLLVFAFYLRTFNRPLRRISKTTEQMARGTASGERILDLMNIESEIRESPNAIAAPRFKGHICFKNVFFEYKSKKPVLTNINLVIEPGERIAVVGHTGSGKSTLGSLLPRFYDTTSGEIFIDGTEIREWTLRSLRKQVSVVFQEPILFATSIAENIAYGKPDATKEEIIEASKKAQIHQLIEALPEGYETVIGERGGTLSGGQRQCVAIARSMIKNAPLIILDEPTSGLDMLSAMLVMKALKELMKNKTVIIISHQIETLQDVDRVIQLNKGTIQKINKPEEFWVKEIQLEPTLRKV
jgi:ABC-type multidrug transport system fused ATPase/permease subunit